MEVPNLELHFNLASLRRDKTRALTELQQSTLEAAVFRVLPSSTSPGAREADVMSFIAWMMTQPCFRRGCGGFIAGLQVLEASAVCKYQRSFHACPPPLQDELLLGLTRVPHATVRQFFATLVRLTVLGFLSPPGYPGNRNNVGFRLMGYADIGSY